MADNTTTKGDGGAAEVDKQVNEDAEKGYHGVRTDPTPLEHYTVPGVVAGKPTPETDAKAAADAEAVRTEAKAKF